MKVSLVNKLQYWPALLAIQDREDLIFHHTCRFFLKCLVIWNANAPPHIQLLEFTIMYRFHINIGRRYVPNSQIFNINIVRLQVAEILFQGKYELIDRDLGVRSESLKTPAIGGFVFIRLQYSIFSPEKCFQGKIAYICIVH